MRQRQISTQRIEIERDGRLAFAVNAFLMQEAATEFVQARGAEFYFVVEGPDTDYCPFVVYKWFGK